MASTEETACTSVLGIPTFRIAAMQPLSAFAVKWIGISRFRRQLIPYPAKHPTHCPITVARAAPAVPIAGMPKYPKIRIGSKTKFVMDAADSVNKNRDDLPLAMTKRSNTHCPIIPREPSIHMRS